MSEMPTPSTYDDEHFAAALKPTESESRTAEEPSIAVTRVLETEAPREPALGDRVTKKIAVTFDSGLPMGTCARFTHEGDIWIAYPSKKSARILTVIDRLLGIYNGLTEEAVRILNKYPDDVGARELAVATLGSVEQAQQRWWDLAVEKTKAATS